MSDEKDIIIRAEHLYKLYGVNKGAAQALIKEGFGKEEIFRQTGVTVAIDHVSFAVERKKIYVLIGLSGSGKSTVVRCLNGLNRPTSGKVLFNGENIQEFSKKELLDYRRNRISMVFQNFGLMSHRDVLSNVAYGLEVRGVQKAKREEKAREIIAMVGLEGWEHKSIANLSGGMRQRVGIARALTNDPDVLLMDEPFSALDPLVRNDMQNELLLLQKKLNKTVVFITHDINEAFKLGDTVTIMKDGKMIQTATPEGMTSHPADEYVEKFINSANKSQVFCAEHIMCAPPCTVNLYDGANFAAAQMRNLGVTNAYVVNEASQYLGMLSLEQVLRAEKGEASLSDLIMKKQPTVTKTTRIYDLMPVAAAAQYPIAVIDAKERLLGIVTQAEVLKSLV
ncbi:MAG TPA: betaine/proline/choline family ABC transporter ATP-binding protein [Clostridiales bacterium]|nr:betaine/proline/choline family ABC transporter ATP-binding protein [Clostridiales bacterium]